MPDEPPTTPSEEQTRNRKFTSDEEIERALVKMQSFTSRLRSLAMTIVLLGFFSLAGLTVSSLLRNITALDSVSLALLTGLSVVASFCGLLMLFVWERRVAAGMILYEEISDEVEWSHRTFRNGKTTENGSIRAQGPSLDIRVILRAFLKETTLPFTRGTNGTTIYALFFVACIVGTITIITIQSH